MTRRLLHSSVVHAGKVHIQLVVQLSGRAEFSKESANVVYDEFVIPEWLFLRADAWCASS